MSIKILWELQKTKYAYEKIKDEYSKSPFIQELKKYKIEIAQLEKELKEIVEKEKEIDKTAKKSYRKELEVEEKENSLKEKLYNGTISNPKELEQLQEKEAIIHKEKEEIEEEYLRLSFQQEDYQSQINKFKNELENKKLKYAVLLANLQNYKEDCQKKLNELADKYKTLKKEIDPLLLEKYKKMYKHYGNTTVASVKGNKCTGCNMELSLALRDKVKKEKILVHCENCGRILYKGD